MVQLVGVPVFMARWSLARGRGTLLALKKTKRPLTSQVGVPWIGFVRRLQVGARPTLHET